MAGLLVVGFIANLLVRPVAQKYWISESGTKVASQNSGNIQLGHGFVACKGGTGTLVELAVVWEMLNKSVIPAKPFVVLGDFWVPILERVRGCKAALAKAPGVKIGAFSHYLQRLENEQAKGQEGKQG